MANKVILMGRLVRDPELRYTTSAEPLAVTRFTLAINRQLKKDKTDFINCVCFGKRAEAIANYVKKGQQLLVTGSWETEQGDKDGNKITYHTCNVQEFEFVGNKAEGENQAPKKQKGYTLPDDKKNPSEFLELDENDEDLPF